MNKNRKNFIDLVVVKAIARLRTEMSKYYLNFLWWILEPMLMMAVFYVVFGLWLQRGGENFVPFLFVGLIPWNWFSSSVERSAASILDGTSLMLLVNIHKTFFPLERLLQDTIKQLIVFAVLLIFLFFYMDGCTATWVALPLIILIQLVINVSVAFLGAALVPFFPDLRFIIHTGVRLMFFSCGIFYNIEQYVSPQHQKFLYMNPMAGLIKSYRDIMLFDRWPDWIYLSKVFTGGVVLLFLSTWMISKLNYIYPKICQR